MHACMSMCLNVVTWFSRNWRLSRNRRLSCNSRCTKCRIRTLQGGNSHCFYHNNYILMAHEQLVSSSQTYTLMDGIYKLSADTV